MSITNAQVETGEGEVICFYVVLGLARRFKWMPIVLICYLPKLTSVSTFPS